MLYQLRSSGFFPAILRASLSFLLGLPAAAAGEEVPFTAAFVSAPPATQRNAHYTGNRAPLSPSPLVPLPLKAIAPRGWLRKQLELQADGFHGRFSEISRFLAKDGNAWLDPHGRGAQGWEEVPYWLKGFAHNAYLLDRKEQIAEAQVWIEGALASQQADGWFGPQKARSTVRSEGGDRDLWPNMIMLFCLQSYYDHSDDARVLDLMRRYFQWELSYLSEQPRRAPGAATPYWHWQQQRAGDNLWSVYWLYNRTGDAWLLDLAAKLHAWGADWSAGIACLHNVNITEGYDTATIFSQQSPEPRLRDSAERNWTSIRAEYGQVPGGLFGADEKLRPGFAGPRQAIETCGMVEEMLSNEQLLQVTGDPRWADRAEDVAFNSLTAAVAADFKALRYLTAPNHPLSDAVSKAPGIGNQGAMYLMSPVRYRCCQHNFGHGWPYLASSLWFATGDNGLAAAFYSASEVTAKVGPPAAATDVTLREETHYPFDERVRLRLETPAAVRFPLYLRIPGWCRSPTVTVNGRTVAITRSDSAAGSDTRAGFVVLDRTWQNSDLIELTLPMELAVRRWSANHDSVSVDRGPLTFSLQIAEEYKRVDSSAVWSSWEIRPRSPWNYGLVLDSTEATDAFKVVQRDWPANDMPFTQEGTPIRIEARGRRIPAWGLDANGLVQEIQASPVRTSAPVETITLIPMGAARLRISAFPVTADGQPAGAHDWTAQATPSIAVEKPLE